MIQICLPLIANATSSHTMYTRNILLALVGILFVAINGISQSDSIIYRIDTDDGNTCFGVIAEETQNQISLRTENLGTITIPKLSIKSQTPVVVSDVVKGQYWLENPQETRYFWQPNGYGLKRGEGYYQNIWVLFNQVSYGVSDHFTIGSGLIPLFLFDGTATPVWITPKVSFPVVKEKFNLGAGAMLGVLIGEVGSGFGIPYALASVGSRNSNLTFGAGWAYADGDFAPSPTLTLSGMMRVSRRTYLMTENYYINLDGDAIGLMILGARSLTKSIGIDYGLLFPVGTSSSTFLAIPWLGITVPFGNKPAYN